MEREELRDLLEHLHDKYNRAEFIEPDPISVPTPSRPRRIAR